MDKFDELAEAQRLAHIGSWYWVAKTDETVASAELCRIFGREAILPFAEQCGTMYSTESWSRLNAATRETLGSGIGYKLELPALRADGTQIWVNMCSEPMRNADGEIAGLRGTVQDITERKQMEIELDEKKRLLDFSMQFGRMGGWDINLLDHTANRTLEHDRIFGYESLQPLWTYALFLEHVLPEDRIKVDRIFQQAITAHSDLDFECRIRRADGEVRWILVAGGHQRSASRLYGIVQDITERKYLDHVLQEKNAELEDARFVAEQANLAKSNFLSSISHELRTPLNAILGFAQLLEAGSPPPTDTQNKRLQQITKAGWYLLELINEILDLALIESGKLTLLREPVSLIKIMRECNSMIESQAQARGIQINFLPFDESWLVSADPTRLKQVIINLLSNSVKYNRAQGTVEVRCTCTPERIRINIKDSGVGLPSELQQQLFQPFNRLGQENGNVEGTGIGLVVTKQLVELMGGTIGVKSTVGVGSEFRFDLPRDFSAQLSAENVMLEEFEAQAIAGLHTLLYVEDNPANLMLVEQIIVDHPHVRMLSARDGSTGIALARTHLPDVILMDINLPGISGIEAMKILRKEPATKHIPVVALSANAMLQDKEQGLEAGFFRYLTKPIQLNEFIATLDEALEFSRRGSINTNETGQIS